MRVIAGHYRGRTLHVPGGTAIRPTSDRVREAVFSALGPLEGVRVLDLYAGSGALGIEALSRDAAHVTFVDSAPRAVAAIRRNLADLGVVEDVAVRREDAQLFLRAARRASDAYDLVFLDPPYRLAPGLGRELSEALSPVLAPGARVVAESDRRGPLDLDLGEARERRYGDTLIRIHGSR
jgi:16S rRNA (guanine966-N2)-methyltransferase